VSTQVSWQKTGLVGILSYDRDSSTPFLLDPFFIFHNVSVKLGAGRHIYFGISLLHFLQNLVFFAMCCQHVKTVI